MPLIDKQKLLAFDAQLKILPTVITYSRLEPVNLSSGDLTPGLEAPIADPLWLVGRQWQFEELRGEDGGSPIVAEIHAERAPVTRFHPGPVDAADPAGASVDVPGPELPVEVAVEAEAPTLLPERVRAELGMQLLRLIRGSGLPRAARVSLEEASVARWQFEAKIDADVDPGGAARRRLLAGRIPDGARALPDVASLRGAENVVTSLPEWMRQIVAANSQRTKLRAVLTTWLSFAERYVATPIGNSWNPQRLEYSFALQATLAATEVALHADEYAGRSIDWYTFDAAAAPSLGAPAVPVAPVAITKQVMPTPVRYPGMPSDRLWAFEDARVFLGGVKAGSTDLARLALVEFSLAFGTDWFLVPLALRYGDVARVHSLSVVDTFGKRIPVQPSRDVSRPGWTVFQNTPVDDGSPLADVFVLPAGLRNALEGPPLEEVALFRDELANLVWGVERIVQGDSGEPVRRGLVESRALRQRLPDDLDDAAIVYRLMTPVPDHWIPFVSVPVPNVPVERFATELERRPMVRFLDTGDVEIVHPHGVLLRADLDGDVSDDRLRIAEEEVPRDGVVVTRRFRLARTRGGETVLWIGRRKEAGQGEGSSGLRFDSALPPAVTESAPEP